MMKALRLEKLGCLALAEVPVPTITEEQLLIRTGATTICTSDLNDLRENPFGLKLPVVMGHEGAGTVARIGARVNGFKVGDRVACHPVHPCGHCPTCRRGLGHLCTEMGHFGLNMPGTFAEYFVVRQDRARVIPDAVPFTAAALAEPVCVCLEALDRARVGPGDRLLIIGDGPFGILMARLAQSRKLGRLAIAGQIDFRLSFAGAAEKINVRRRALDGEYDAVILAVGVPEAFVQGIAALVPRGRLVLFSAVAGEPKVDWFRVLLKELEIVGACNDADLLDDAIGLLPVATGLVTHQYKLEDHATAIALAATGQATALKVAFTFEGVTA